jgi:hypothetical protein
MNHRVNDITALILFVLFMCNVNKNVIICNILCMMKKFKISKINRHTVNNEDIANT